MLTLSQAFFGCFCIMSSTLVFAQQSETPLLPTAIESVERISVSGKRPDKPVQSLPAQINVLSSEEISAWQIANGEDIAQSLANVELRTASPMSANMAIRGVGAENWHINTNPGVQIAIDETNVLGPYGNRLMLFDLERIEVYRGPQNGLFGINSSGGAIYLESVKPKVDEVSGFAQISLGNDGYEVLQSALNVPLSKNLASRVAVYYKQRDPLWHNLFNDRRMGSVDNQAVRWHVLWSPSKTQSALLTAQYGADNSSRLPYLSNGYWDVNGSNVANGNIIDLDAPVDCPDLLPPSSANFNRPSNCVTVLPFSGGGAAITGAGNWYETYDAAEDISKVAFNTVKLKYTHALDIGQLISITAFDEVDSAYMETLSNLPQGLAFMPAQANEKTQFTQELRLSNALNQTQTQWLLGAYFAHAEDYFGTIVTRADNGGAPFGIVPSVSIDQTTIVRSVFGLYETRFADNWQFSMNLRYSYEHKYGVSTTRVMAKTDTGTPSGIPLPLGDFISRTELETITANPAGICPPNIGGFPCELPTPVEQISELTGGNISLGYYLSDHAQLYTQISRGFLSGAFDTRALAAFAGTAENPVKPETIHALEIGYKGEWSNININGAAFWYDWQNKQTFDVNNEGAPAFLNIPAATLQGIDGEFQWSINDHWDLRATLGLIQSEITDVGTLIFTQTGNELSSTPRWSTSLHLRYRWQWSLGESQVSVTHSAKDEYFASNNNTLDNLLAASQITNVFWQHEFIDPQWQHWQINAGVTNLTNEKTCLALTNNGSLSYTKQCTPNTGKAQWYIGMKVSL